ncbi:MAG TPA: hypothetical protein VL282_06590, partial [Tepidisphaeraceae bacterium]|nr:hypothetical protein [Tepidisphaeraceae bacterium]
MTTISHFGNIVLILVVLLSGGLQAAPAPLLEVDFGKGDRPIPTVDKEQQKVSGSLPAGWADDSTFQKQVDVRYDAVSEPDKTFLRVHHSGGKFQIKSDISDEATEETLYRLSLELRSAERSPVVVSIFEPGKPRKQLWTRLFDTSEIWNEASASFRLPPHKAPLNLMIWSFGDVTDIGKMSIIRETTSDLIERIKREHPDGDKAINLLHNTRFPLGIQSGWAIDRDHSDEDIELAADEKVIGPSGSPALKLHSTSPMFTEVTPFDIPWTFHPHVASIYARGKGALRLIVRGADRELAAANAQLKQDAWTRLVLPFQPVLLGTLYQLQFYSSGDVWIDALQVEPGKKEHDYASAMRAEVALGWPKSEVSAARIQFEDEPAIMDWAVTNGPADGHVM